MRNTAIALRGVYFAFLALFLLTGRVNLAAVFTPPFIISYLLIYRNGSRDHRFYLADSLLSTGFVLALGLWMLDFWAVDQTRFGIDKILHGIAGAALGLTGACYYKGTRRSRLGMWGAGIGFALGIGVAWEIFEWSASFAPFGLAVPWSGFTDTIFDLASDLAGAILILLWTGIAPLFT